MTYAEFETSAFSSQPVELYTFTIGSTQFRFTSGQVDIQTQTQGLFEAQPIQRANIDATQDISKSSLTITGPNDLPFVRQYVLTPPSSIVNLLIQRFQRQDDDDELIILYTGRVNNVAFRSGDTVEIRCESIYTTLRRPALRRYYQLNCPYKLYDSNTCRAIENQFVDVHEVTSIDGLTINYDDTSLREPNYYTGGILRWSNGDPLTAATRFVRRNESTGVVVINAPIPLATSGNSITITAGCAHNITDCRDKFSNLENYGGFPFIPSKNPMNGTPIF